MTRFIESAAILFVEAIGCCISSRLSCSWCYRCVLSALFPEGSCLNRLNCEPPEGMEMNTLWHGFVTDGEAA